MTGQQSVVGTELVLPSPFYSAFSGLSHLEEFLLIPGCVIEKVTIIVGRPYLYHKTAIH